jgi:nitroimidazol reductase NimA-like FMN-containing flavoprotein (pyridoxamine 5'-phosphate oxidase superfamily)
MNGSPTVQAMSDSESLDALANATIGRVALVVDGAPEVIPATYVLDGDMVVFRSGDETLLAHAGMAKVAFQVDHIDETSHTGSSVVVHGYLYDITDTMDATSERLRRRPLVTWAPTPRDRWFEIRPYRIAGRRLRVVPPDSQG